jgi:hypothetical protein
MSGKPSLRTLADAVVQRETAQDSKRDKPFLTVPNDSVHVGQSGDPASEALAILKHLKGYTLPEGRIPAARAISERLRPLLAGPELDPTEALATLRTAEGELTALGAIPDPELANAVSLVTAAFPGAGLIEVSNGNEARAAFLSRG